MLQPQTCAHAWFLETDFIWEVSVCVCVCVCVYVHAYTCVYVFAPEATILLEV